MALDLKALELIYRNAETEAEMNLALEYHCISRDEFIDIAMTHGWPTNPIAVQNLSAQVASSPLLLPADNKHIEESNKASVRRLHGILEHAITKFQLEMANLSMAATLDGLEIITKIREKLTKLEYPLYGLSTAEPPAIPNPINIFLNTDEETSSGKESDG